MRIWSAHTPYLARWFIGFVAAVRQPNVGAVSDVKLRNLATIKTSMTNECNYCSTHTSIYGQALGVSEPQLEAMKGDAWETSPLFGERERAVTFTRSYAISHSPPGRKVLGSRHCNVIAKNSSHPPIGGRGSLNTHVGLTARRVVISAVGIARRRLTWC
jgi:hypothetical protein